MFYKFSIFLLTPLLTSSLTLGVASASFKDEGDTSQIGHSLSNEKKGPTLTDLPAEIIGEIFKYLGPRDLLNLSETSKKYYDAKDLYVKSQFNQIFKDIGIEKKDLENEHHLPLFKKALETKADLKNLTTKFKKQIENQGFALINSKNFYAPYLRDILKDYKEIPLSQIIPEPKTEFESITNLSIHRDIKVYGMDKKEIDGDALQKLKRDLQKYTRGEQEKYIDVKSLFGKEDLDKEALEKLKTAPYHLVINDKDLDEINKKRLEELLEVNPEHIIHLDAGERFVNQNGVLSIENSDLPSNIKHLKISNIKGNVTTIRYYFLAWARSLTSVDMSGFKSLTTIGNYFLAWAGSLTSFDMSGLKSLETIWCNFLYGAKALTSLDMSGLKSLTIIEEGFLYGTKALKEMVAYSEEQKKLLEETLLEQNLLERQLDLKQKIIKTIQWKIVGQEKK